MRRPKLHPRRNARATRHAGPAALFLLCLDLAPTGRAVASEPQEILLPEQRAVSEWRWIPAAENASPAPRAFADRAGGAWLFWWNTATGTPHQAQGPGIEANRALIEDESAAEAAARRFVRAHAGLFGTDGADLALSSASHGAGKWGIVFAESRNGIPVLGGRAHVVMTETGRVYNFGADVHAGFHIAAGPVLSSRQCLDRARIPLGAAAGIASTLDDGRRVLVPDTREGRNALRFAWQCRLAADKPLGRWRVTVDAETGEILECVNEIAFLDFSGNSRGSIDDFDYCDGAFERPVASETVTIDGVGGAVTDAAGDFSLPYGGSDPKPLSTEFRGPFLNVNNALGPDALFLGTITPGEPFQIDWTPANSRPDERAAWLHANRIHDWVKAADPTWAAPDYEMPANVNIDDGSGRFCQAWWDGYGINFFRKGEACANPARIGDMIYHEYGHGITQWIYGENACDVGEANSDVAAMLIEGDPLIAEGIVFPNCFTWLRNCANALRYPDDYAAGQCYENGQILCGFWWDAREELLQSYSEEEATEILRSDWHWSRRLAHPLTFPDQVLEAFVADDDDGDLTNGTPHGHELCVAAQNHGFTCLTPARVPDDGLPSDLRFEPAVPNPFGAGTKLVIDLRQDAWVRLRIVEAGGRLVRNLEEGRLPAGRHTAVWDGRDRNGRLVPSGVYWAVCDAGGRRAARLIVRMQ